MKKAICVILAAVFFCLSLGGCGEKKEQEDAVTVRYLNFKPEIASKYEELAREYERETGVKVVVETAANNTYEQTLTAKMATDEAPTLFQINGPRGYANWKNYCADLSATKLYAHLTDKSLAIKDGAQVVGIPYVVEGYGIIYNAALTDAYFALTARKTDYQSMEDIRSFDALKKLTEDMQLHKKELGIDGVFASTSLKSGEDWRWQTHLLNVPLSYEFMKNTTDLTGKVDTIKLEYADNYKNIFDLYLNNSTTDRKLVGSKTVADSMAEFALEKCVMVQNGNWAWGQIAGVTGNKVKAENVKFLPIYTGMDGDEKQGLCIGTENFYAINKKASEAAQKAAADFVYWIYSSEKGKKYVVEEFGFIAPFDTFTDKERPSDPLANEVLDWMDKDGIRTIPWNFTAFPSVTFKERLGAALLKYAQGTKTWEALVKETADSWKKEQSAAA